MRYKLITNIIIYQRVLRIVTLFKRLTSKCKSDTAVLRIVYFENVCYHINQTRHHVS